MVSGFTVSETGKPEKPGKNWKQKLHLTDAVWQSLARDYLAIMALSVSSERAFSSAGITISKRRNRLDGDIVEALQCLKSFIHEDIMVRDLNTVAEEEVELDKVDKQYANQDRTTIEAVEWEDDARGYVNDSDDGNMVGGDDETETLGSQA